jgi:hypothetical protein
LHDSEKLQKFERLAEKRMANAIRTLRLLGNLANRSNYSYTQEHVGQMLRALKNELRSLESRFLDKAAADAGVFKFNLRSGRGAGE